MDFALYKSNTIQRRISRRLVLSKQNTLDDYANFLRENAKEFDALYSDVLISVTSFFRNPRWWSSYGRTSAGGTPQDPVRVDVRKTLVLPRALLDAGAVAGGARVVLQDHGGVGTLRDRVAIDITAVPFYRLEAAPLVGHSVKNPSSGTPGERRLVMVAPDIGLNLRITQGASLALQPLSRRRFWTMLKVCVTPEGSVEQASFIRAEGDADGAVAGTLDPADGGALVSTVGRWRHRPYLLNGQAVAYCYPLRLQSPHP